MGTNDPGSCTGTGSICLLQVVLQPLQLVSELRGIGAEGKSIGESKNGVAEIPLWIIRFRADRNEVRIGVIKAIEHVCVRAALLTWHPGESISGLPLALRMLAYLNREL